MWGMGVPGAHVPDRWGKPQKGSAPPVFYLALFPQNMLSFRKH